MSSEGSRARSEVVAEVATTPVRHDGRARSTSSARRWCGPPASAARRRAGASGWPTRAPRALRGAGRRPARALDRDPVRADRRGGHAWSGPRPPDREGRRRARRRRPASADDRVREAIRSSPAGRVRGAEPGTGRPLFAFRLHQFLSKGDTVYVTLEDPRRRHLTRNYQLASARLGRKILLPLAFCRECGQEYLAVWRDGADDGAVTYRSRRDTSATGGAADDGYLYVDSERPGRPTSRTRSTAAGCPSPGWRTTTTASEVVRDSYRKRLPARGHRRPVRRRGARRAAGGVHPGAVPVLPALRGQLRAGARQGLRQAGHAGPGGPLLGDLAGVGLDRPLAAQIPPDALDQKARKLLTFVDNRQDASLQAGHFNDFVQVTQLRGALYRALVRRTPARRASSTRTSPNRVTEALGLDLRDFAGQAELAPFARRERRANAARRRRVPALPRPGARLAGHHAQPGADRAARVDYADLDWIAARRTAGQRRTRRCATPTPGQRAEIMRALLDEMRRVLRHRRAVLPRRLRHVCSAPARNA